MKLLSFWYRRRRIPLKEARLGDIYTAEGIWRKPEMFMPKVVGIIADIKRRDAGDYCLLLVSPEEPEKLLQWSDKASRSCENGNDKSSLFEGKSNTSLILFDGIAKGYNTPAADFCHSCREIAIQYLPALGELERINRNLNAVNNGLRKINAPEIAKCGFYASSSEKNDASFWAFDFAEGKSKAMPKFEYFRVRPVITVLDSE